MRAVTRLFLALPDPGAHQGPVRDGGPAARIGGSWVATPLIGLAVGIAWFVAQQLTTSGVGPLVSGVVVVAVGAALTGARGHRGLAGVATDTARHTVVRAGPPAAGAAPLWVTLVVLAQVALLQRVSLAPAMVVVIPMASRSAQALLLRGGDTDVGVDAPTAAHKVAISVVAWLLLLAPAALTPLERPVRLDGPLSGIDSLVLGSSALLAALLVGLLTRGWLLARHGRLDPAGWHSIGLTAEVAALVVVAVRIG